MSRDRRTILSLALALLTTCRSGPPRGPLIADDRDRLIALMGGIDAHLLEIQVAAGDPLEPGRIRGGIAALREKVENACRLELSHAGFRIKAEEAIATLRELEETPWTPGNRLER